MRMAYIFYINSVRIIYIMLTIRYDFNCAVNSFCVGMLKTHSGPNFGSEITNVHIVRKIQLC